jgi:phosphonate transport system substrate-binding protein
VQDMRGKTLCMADKVTSAGYLFSLQYMRDQQIENPEEFFERFCFAGSHEAVIRNVFKSRRDVGAVKNLVFLKMAEENPQISEELVVLANSADFPTNGLAIRENFDWDVKEDLQKVLLHMHEDPEALAILMKLGADKFVVTTEEEYENVHALLRSLKIDPVRFLDSEDNSSMPSNRDMTSEQQGP